MPRPLHELCFLAAAVSIGTVHAQAQTIADLAEAGQPFGSYVFDDRPLFGEVIAMSDDWLMIASPGSSIGNGSPAWVGEIAVYRRVGDDIVQTDWISEYGPDLQFGSRYGSAIAIDGNRAVIGVDQYDVEVNGKLIEKRGRIDVWKYENNSWDLEQTLDLPEGTATSWGTSVDIEGDLIVAGAPDFGTLIDERGSGAAAAWRLAGGTWTLEAELSPLGPVSDPQSYFGYSCAIENGTVVVGAPGWWAANNSRGAVIVYEYSEDLNSWNAIDYLDPTNLGLDHAEGVARFGRKVAMDGESVLVSAPSTTINSMQGVGAAYLFKPEADGLLYPVQTFSDPQGAEDDNFGDMLFLREDEMIMIGSYCDARILPAGSWHGMHEFRYAEDAFVNVRTILPERENLGDFGKSFVMDGDVGFIGAPSSLVEYKGKEYSSQGVVIPYRLRNVRNIDAPDGGQYFDDLDNALHSAEANDRLLIRQVALPVSGMLQVGVNPVQLIGVEPLNIPADLSLFLSDNTTINVSEEVGNRYLALSGSMVLQEDGFAAFDSGATGLQIADGGAFYQNNSTVFVGSQLETGSGGEAFLKGTVMTDLVYVEPGGMNRVHGDTDVLGNYTNKGTTLVHRGVLYVVGNLENSGVLLGEVDDGPGFLPGDEPATGDGVNISGDYTVGRDASLLLPDPAWWLRVGGNLDVEIDDPSRFVMGEATVQMNGFSLGVQELEAMSEDLGAVEAGFDASNFPLGGLRLTADATVEIVNRYENSTSDPCEVIYARELVVPAGATLITGGCPVYVKEAFIDGKVDDPDAVIVVGESCLGDITGDGEINGADLGLLLGAWGVCGEGPCPADLTGDGTVNGADLGILLAVWGGCS